MRLVSAIVPATAAAASASELCATSTMRLVDMPAVTTPGSTSPFFSIATPMRSLPSPPVLETVFTCVASASISTLLAGVFSSGLFAMVTSCTFILATVANASARALVPTPNRTA